MICRSSAAKSTTRSRPIRSEARRATPFTRKRRPVAGSRSPSTTGPRQVMATATVTGSIAVATSA